MGEGLARLSAQEKTAETHHYRRSRYLSRIHASGRTLLGRRTWSCCKGGGRERKRGERVSAELRTLNVAYGL